MIKALPEIIALGVYDASLIHKNKRETSPRRVRMYEIEAVTEDGGTTYVDGESYPIRKGNIIIGKPGQMRHTDLPFKCLYLHLTVTDGELDSALCRMPNVYTPTDGSIIKAFERLISAHASPETDLGTLLASELLLFLSILIKDVRLYSARDGARPSRAETVEKAMRFMNENLCESITLSEIADHVFLSKIYFHKLFVSATGRTPYQYLLERRIAYAKKLLTTTSLSMGEITRKCGFSSQSYFNQIFKRELNITPLGYKKQMSLQY